MEFLILLTTFVLQMTDSKNHIAGAPACAKSTQGFRDDLISDVCDESVEDDPDENLPSDAKECYPAVIVKEYLASLSLVDVH